MELRRHRVILLYKSIPVLYSLVIQINDGSQFLSLMDSLYYQNVTQEVPSNLFHAFEVIFEHMGRDYYDVMMDD